MFTSLMKAATAIVDVPVSVARDVITGGGTLDGSKEYPGDGTHTGDALRRFAENIKDAADPKSRR